MSDNRTDIAQTEQICSDFRHKFAHTLHITMPYRIYRICAWNPNKFVRISDSFETEQKLEPNNIAWNRTNRKPNKLLRTRLCSVFGVVWNPNVRFSDIDCMYNKRPKTERSVFGVLENISVAKQFGFRTTSEIRTMSFGFWTFG